MVKVKDLNYPTYEARNPERWRLPNTITKSICLLAGREASASLRIALGRHNAANAAHEATCYEPFTYWDWHGVAPDDAYAREYKRQRMWEYHGGFEINGIPHGYPTPKERWIAFRVKVDSKVIDPRWVKRIAVAHWMSINDLHWILRNLYELTDLDLSDAPTRRAGVAHPWALLLERDMDSLEPFPPKLEWLGIPDFRDSNTFALELVQKRCTKLRTLSIRGKQSEGKSMNPHDYICKLPYMIATYVPKSVTTLELRFSFPYLNRLASVLKEGKSSIRRIGIDFGVWVQEYPKNPASKNKLEKDAIKDAATLAARKARFEAYEKAHDETLGAAKQWILPESQSGQELEQDCLEHAKHAFEHDFYVQQNGSVLVSLDWTHHPGGSKCALEKAGHHEDLSEYVESMDNSTLPAMLSGLHQFGRVHKHIELFTLDPEWQERSMDPVHPLALLQTGAPSDATSMSGAYQWLNSTFKWRPVFDWDSFIGPNPKGSHKALLERWNLDLKLKPEQLLDRISTQFHLLTEVNIPIHILLGHRHPDKPSMYWDTPTAPPSSMEKYLRTLFEFNLKPIAPLISRLSIMYDLRSPLSTNTAPSLATATCPRPTCPWLISCPFPLHPTWPASSFTSSYSKQKMANAKPIKMSDPNLPDLAPNTPYLPHTGHLSQHPEDEDTLPVASRNAAFAREAIAWQKFWAEYAPLLTALDTLNVRMPKVFDGTGSIKLARLLDEGKGWAMRAWADESALAAGWSVRNGVLVGEEEYDGGGGEFVRRCWVRREEDVVEKKVEVKQEKVEEMGRGKRKRGALKREMDVVDEPWEMHAFGDTNMDMDVFRAPYPDEAVLDFDEAPDYDMHYDYPYALERGEESVDDPALSETEMTSGDIEEKDKEELHKAVDRAVEAAEIVERLEASDTSAPKTVTELEKRLKTMYGKRVARVARHAWLQSMRGYVQDLESDEAGRNDVLRVTRADLQARLAHFRPEDVFVEDDGMKNGIGLVKQERNFAAEELEKRGGLQNDHPEGAGEKMQEPEELEELGDPDKGYPDVVGEDSDGLGSLFSSDADHPSEQPDNTDNEDGDFYGVPATHVEPVNIVDSTPPHTARQIGTQMTPNLDDILSTLQTHGGVLTHAHPPQHSSNDLSHDVRQSIEFSEMQSTVTQPGSKTVERTTSAQIKIESVPAPSMPGIGQAPQQEGVQGLPKGKLYSSPPPKTRSEIELGLEAKMAEVEGEEKRNDGSEKGVTEVARGLDPAAQPIAPQSEADVPPPPKQATPAKKPSEKPSEKQGEEPSTSEEPAASHQKPVVSAKLPTPPPKRPTPPPQKPTPTPPPKTTSKQPRAKNPSPSPPSPTSPPKKPPKQPAPKKSPAPKKTPKPKAPPSPSPAPTKRPARKRKDPVLAELEGKDQKEKDDVLGRARMRGASRSRSGTPAYKETSEEDGEGGVGGEGDGGDEGDDNSKKGTGRGARGKAKVKAKGKRKADEEWGGGRGKRGKKSE